MQVTVSKDDIKERTADGRGRITLGAEYANEAVEVAVLNHG